MRLRSLALLLAVLLASCKEDKPLPEPSTPAEGFRISFRDGGISVTHTSRPQEPLLESLRGGSETYAPLALRKASAHWEMMYGAFKVTEGSQPWRTAATSGWEETVAGMGPTVVREEITPEQIASGSAPAVFVDQRGERVATLRASSPADGVLLLDFEALIPEMNRISAAFACAPGDRFLGFGAQADALDHRGHKIPIWTSEPGIGKSDSDDPPAVWMLEGSRHASSMGLPTWLSNRGYVAVVESDARSLFELCSARSDAWRAETWGPRLKLWIYYGPTPAKALERATAGLLGRPPRPPPLAFAPWHDAIFGSERVREIARLIRDSSIPSSALWTEDFRGGFENPQGYRLLEEWELDRNLYPNAEGLADELRAMGFSWFAYFNTFLVKDTRIYAEAQAGGHFVRAPDGAPYIFDGVTFVPSGLADLSRPETREWVRSYLRKALDVGFDGWMADFGEWLPPDALLASGEDPLLAHNRYPDEWAKLNAEVLAERADDGRQRLFFSRSGWLGTAKQVPVYWAGDQRTSFQADDGLPTVITLGLNLGLAGVSTYGHDIAGYQSATNPPSTRELYFRWTTLGALSPVMRTHHGIDAEANWWFGKDEETIAHFKRWASFHIRLFPYFDAGSAIAEATGLPLMRAFALEIPGWDQGWSVKDEYLLGPAILVAPVIEEGSTSRKVLLPPGLWLPWDGGEPIEGPAMVEVAAPITEIPLFGRAGGVVPMLPEGVQTLLPAEPPVVDLDDVEDRRELRLFPGAAGSFSERDGTTYALSVREGSESGFSEAGAALPECSSAGQRGCVASEGDLARVRLAGQGPLEAAGWRLEISGGAQREIDVIVRR